MGRRREILRYHCAAVMKENVLAENLPNVFLSNLHNSI